MNGNANRTLTAAVKVREMKTHFSSFARQESNGSTTSRSFPRLLQESQNGICRTFPDAKLMTVVRELHRGFGDTKILNDDAAEAILHVNLTPSQQKDKLVEYLKKDPRIVVCERFLDALEAAECFSVLEILYDSYLRLK